MVNLKLMKHTNSHNGCVSNFTFLILVVNSGIDYAKWCIMYKHRLMFESVQIHGFALYRPWQSLSLQQWSPVRIAAFFGHPDMLSLIPDDAALSDCISFFGRKTVTGRNWYKLDPNYHVNAPHRGCWNNWVSIRVCSSRSCESGCSLGSGCVLLAATTAPHNWVGRLNIIF